MANELTPERAGELLDALNLKTSREENIQVLRLREFIKKTAIERFKEYLKKLNEWDYSDFNEAQAGIVISSIKEYLEDIHIEVDSK